MKNNDDSSPMGDALVDEMERAIRGDYGLFIMGIRVKNFKSGFLSILKESLRGALRKIDHIFIQGSQMVMIFPFTDKSGSMTAKNKVIKTLLEMGISYRIIEKTYFRFPNDVENKSLVSEYRFQDIKNEVLKHLASQDVGRD